MRRDRHGTPVLSGTEARQARPRGVIWILVFSTSLAVMAGLGFAIYYGLL